MVSIEKQNGIHSREKRQTDRTKTMGEQYTEHHKLDWSKCDSNKPIEIKSKTKVIDGSDDGMY